METHTFMGDSLPWEAVVTFDTDRKIEVLKVLTAYQDSSPVYEIVTPSQRDRDFAEFIVKTVNNSKN